MIQHLFKIIWNRKNKNFLIILQLFLCFAIMFAVFTMGTYYFQSYRQPAGFDYASIWVITRTENSDNAVTDSTNTRAAAILLDQVIKQQLAAMPEIKGVTYTSVNTPYSNRIYTADIASGKAVQRSDLYTVEDNYTNVTGMHMVSGRWFSHDDDGANYKPVILNEKMKELLFGPEEAVNKMATVNGKDYKVVGIVNNTKTKGDYAEPDYSAYVRADTSFYGKTDNKSILIRINPGAGAPFENRLHKTLSNLMKTSGIEISYLDKKRAETNEVQLVPLIVMIILSVFFITNVALGLFGVLWYNINKRKGEIGLRMAIGAPKRAISLQLVGEVMVLATLSLGIGCFFAIQFPLMNVFDIPTVTYLLGLLMAIAFIYLLVIVCAVYPGRQAAAIQPAIALHED